MTSSPETAGKIAPESLLMCAARGSRLRESTRDAGWTSLLVDRNEVALDREEWTTRATPDQSIVVLLRGRHDLESFAGGAWRCATYDAGTVGLTRGGERSRLRRIAPSTLRTIEKANLFLPSLLLAEASDAFTQPGRGMGEAKLDALAFADPMLVQFALTLLGAAAGGAPDLYAASAANWLAVHLLTHHAGHIDPARLGRPDVTDRRLKRTIEMMRVRFAEPLHLDELAAEAGISKFHFVRLFREKTGMTPHAKLREIRLDSARDLLDATDLDLASIADRCGFANTSHFGRAFGRRFGRTPGRWRPDKRR